MTKYLNHPDHKLSYVEDVTREFDAKVDDDGDIVFLGEADVLDAHDSRLWCTACGPLWDDEFEDHGINEEWQIV